MLSHSKLNLNKPNICFVTSILELQVQNFIPGSELGLLLRVVVLAERLFEGRESPSELATETINCALSGAPNAGNC